MIEKIIKFSIHNKIIVGLFVLAIIVWGMFSLKTLPIDAVPDITNNQVQIISIAPTLAANEVEQFITAPIEVAMANIPDKVELRSISRLGLSVVTVVFEDQVDMYWARQQIGERLKETEEVIPKGLTTPELAPISTGLSEIYQYVLHVKPGYEKKYNTMQLRTIQDWIVRREMMGTPGVADVNSYGGFLQQYEVTVNPERLKAMDISLNEIFNTLEKNNQNTGGAYIEKNPQAYFVRGIGLVSSIEDIENMVVKNTPQGLPLLISDVAKVQFGSAPRYGAFIVDTTGEEVGGVVMMLKGKNASEVIGGVKERIKLIEKSLPEGIEIQPYYDRTELVDRAVNTVSKNLIEGGLIVIFILVLLLGNLRAGLIVASVIPLSMLFAISLMKLFGVSGNLMSLGAIDFGLIVDGAVIIVESVVHRIAQKSSEIEGKLKLSQTQMDKEVLSSAKRMMNSATFGQIIILIVYLPILALVGIEGKMFRPMAETVSFAILGALVLSLTYIPVVSSLFLSRKTEYKTSFSDRIMNTLHKVFDPTLLFALRHKVSVVLVSLFLFIISFFLFNSLGGEFIPTLEEGDLASGVMTLQGGSLSNTIETVEKANKILMSNFPEVKHAICKIGTGEIPTDPTPMETGDYIIVMKDKKEWTSAPTREKMMEKMQEELSVLKGVVFTLQQPIQMRFNELMTGSKQDVAIKIFGDNLDTLVAKAEEVSKMIRNTEGVEEINVESVTGSGQVQVHYNRKKIAQFGLSIADINLLLKTAFAGSSAGTVFDEEKRFDLVVRFDQDYRDDIDHIKDMYVPLPNGNQIPLEQLATIEIKTGVAQISRESTKRRITVSFNVRNRDIQSIIKEISTKIDKDLKRPPGYYITYGGQFENLVAANKRLAVALPMALFLIFILLFFAFKSLKQTLLIFSAVPFSMIGGAVALFVRDMNFSISAGVGFIALFGVAVLNGIVLIAEFNRLKEKGLEDIYERVIHGIKARFRPVIMTAAVASLGFLPMALSTSAGAEVQKPLATVVIGGLISATLLTLIVLPVLYILFSEKKKRKRFAYSKSLLVLIFAALMISRGQAQSTPSKVFSLKQALEQALLNNQTISSANMQVAYQKKLKCASWEFEKTNVDYAYGQMNSVAKDNSFGISQNFSSVFQNLGRQGLAKAYIKNAELGLKMTQVEIISNVKTIYSQLLFDYSKLKLLRYQDSLYSIFLKTAELKNTLGESPLLEKMAAETRAMEIKIQLQQLHSDILVHKRKLGLLINEKAPIEIAETELFKMTSDINFDSNSTQSIPSLQLMKQQVEISKREKQVEKLNLMPDLSIGYMNQSNKDLGEGKRFTGVQVGVAVPLIFFSKSAKVQAYKINEQIAQNNYELFEAGMKNEMQSLNSEFQKQKSTLAYFENYALKQAHLIIEQSGKSYLAGNIDYVEYVLNLDKALEIESSYLQCLNAFNQAVIELEKLSGKWN